MTVHWETKGWRKEVDRRMSSWKKDNKVLWNTGRFTDVYHQEVSEWIDKWTVADVIDGEYKNHRSYNSFEEALEKE